MHTNTRRHTQIPESTDEKRWHSGPTNQSARFNRGHNGASQWAAEDDGRSVNQSVRLLIPVSLIFSLSPSSFHSPSSFFPGWISQWLKVVRRGHRARSTSHTLAYESPHCGLGSIPNSGAFDFGTPLCMGFILTTTCNFHVSGLFNF